MKVVSLSSLARRVLDAPPRLGTVRLVCVDGPAGSGKTTLGGRLAYAIGRAIGADPLAMFPMRDGRLGTTVLHMDDLYEGWDGLDAGVRRLDEWVLRPLREGRPGRYRRYDWATGAYAEWHDVQPPTVLIVEGVGSAGRPARSDDADTVLTIWMQAPDRVRYDRSMERDGDGFAPFWQMWAEQEEAHFAAQRTAQRADLVLDTSGDVPHDQRTDVVVAGEP